MTEILIQYIETVALHAAVWGFLVVFLLMTVESSLIPFPSEVVMIPAGFLAAHGRLSLGSPLADLILVILIGTLGSLAGASFNYFLAARAGRPFLRRYGKYFFLPTHHLDRAEELFNRYGPGTTFVCRLIPAIRQLISLPAGLARMPVASFALWTGLGAGIWVTVLALIGYSLGHSTAGLSYADLVHQGKASISDNLLWILLGCAVVFSAYVWLTSRVMGKKPSPADA